jgi:hypothetical protein
VAGSCEYGDEPSGSGAMELVCGTLWNITVKTSKKKNKSI